ncbi:protein FAM167A-like isoform X2 [Myxocyprinus asiaticus]|uniref:protein FAM167A-like isoform X2 n=1 Tax=Myxocyprinus asiaticus TaxID=70543 RepID=UPI0022226B7F|nr:protein FAM167A-like isoform X2 [Myxocyprinus asiaticus]
MLEPCRFPEQFPVMLDCQDDHLSSLKALTEKLKLETKKSSVLNWRAQLGAMLAQSHKFSEALAVPSKAQEQRSSDPLKRAKPLLSTGVFHGETQMGFENIDQALEWIRKELVEMRLQDQQLARQLMRLRSDINNLRIVQTCNQHRKMLNDATFELEERDNMSDLCDVPMSPGLGFSTTLKVIGVTKMNINTRRFSLC